MLKPSKRLSVRLRARRRKLFRPGVIEIDGLRIRSAPRRLVRGLYKETYEWEERELVKLAVKSDDRVLEIGAGIGLISLLCARICGSESVLSYEANTNLESIIRENFTLNGMTPNLRMRALGVSAGETDFYIGRRIQSSSIYERGPAECLKVPSDAIDKTVTEFAPTCIVMDAEGMEIDLLPAAPLHGVRTLLVEMHPHVVGTERVAELDKYLKNSSFLLNDFIGDVYCYTSRERCNQEVSPSSISQ